MYQEQYYRHCMLTFWQGLASDEGNWLSSIVKCQALNAVILSEISAHSNFCLLFFERHIIAALYFNLKLLREVKKNADGTEQVKVVWPKFKNGEATVRDVKLEPNYGKIYIYM